MRNAIFLAVSAVTTSALAQDATQSKPFRLLLVAQNATTNGTVLGACHEGAAIEGLCPAGKITDPAATYTTFYHNSTYSTPTNSSIGDPGILGWDLHFGGENSTQVAPSAMSFSIDPSSNVAMPIFEPGSNPAQYVAFDDSSLMNIQTYLDDSTSPPTTNTTAYRNWYLCSTYYAYRYTTLVWVLGKDPKPQNPTCQKVEVKRVFI